MVSNRLTRLPVIFYEDGSDLFSDHGLYICNSDHVCESGDSMAALIVSLGEASSKITRSVVHPLDLETHILVY